MGFSRQEHWSGLPFPPPGIFPPRDPTQVSCTAGGFFTPEPAGKPDVTWGAGQRSQEVATQHRPPMRPLLATPGSPQLPYLGPRHWLQSRSWRWRLALSVDRQGTSQKMEGFQESPQHADGTRPGTEPPAGQPPASDCRRAGRPRGRSTQDLGDLGHNVELLGSPQGPPAQGPPALKGWLLASAYSPWEASPSRRPFPWGTQGNAVEAHLP